MATDDVQRISQDRRSGWSRVHARVLSAGPVRIGDRVHMQRPT